MFSCFFNVYWFLALSQIQEVDKLVDKVAGLLQKLKVFVFHRLYPFVVRNSKANFNKGQNIWMMNYISEEWLNGYRYTPCSWRNTIENSFDSPVCWKFKIFCLWGKGDWMNECKWYKYVKSSPMLMSSCASFLSFLPHKFMIWQLTMMAIFGFISRTSYPYVLFRIQLKLFLGLMSSQLWFYNIAIALIELCIGLVLIVLMEDSSGKSRRLNYHNGISTILSW